jgi:hypothetical protein
LIKKLLVKYNRPGEEEENEKNKQNQENQKIEKENS